MTLTLSAVERMSGIKMKNTSEEELLYVSLARAAVVGPRFENICDPVDSDSLKKLSANWMNGGRQGEPAVE